MVSYLFIIMVVSDVTATLTSSRIVRTKYGDVTGVIVTPDSRHLDAVEIFRGIPYASPPVGNLRFMPPVTGALWSGVKLADKFSPVCPQRLPDIGNEASALKHMPRGRLNYLKRLLPYLQNQDEDCLYLNIYVPVQVGETNRKYPVLVLVHGESYEWNSGNPYDGTVLASYGGLLVVTINYRLGVLGFLNTNLNKNTKSPSNYGLMDQIAALHWLQENVSVFGGDPTNVTLLGHGTGAACVNFLMTSSAIPDGSLFHRAILMSGSSLSHWALVKDPIRCTMQVAAFVNCSLDLSQSTLLKCLRSRPLELFLNVRVQTPEFTSAFGPSIDGVVIDTDLSEFISMYFDSDLLKLAESYKQQGQNDQYQIANDVFQKMIARLSRFDLMLGLVPAESFSVFTADDIQFGIEAERRSNILRTFIKNTYKYHLTEILATIINEYTDWERPVQHPVTIRDGTLEALTDAQYAAPVLQIADFHSSVKRNSYLYVFEYQTKFGDYQQRQGCVHGEELPYVLGAPLVGGLAHFARNYTKPEMFLAEATITYWSNFAKTGTPNNIVEQEIHVARPDKNRIKPIEWIAYENIHKKYLILDMKPKLKNHYRAHKLSFWLNLVPEMHRSGSQNVPALHHMFRSDAPELGKLSTVRPKPPRPIISDEDVPPAGVSNEIMNVSNSGSQQPVVMIAHSSYNRSHNDVDVNYRGVIAPSSRDENYPLFSTALFGTIGVGCTLLLLNVLAFVAIYCRDKAAKRSKHDRSSCQKSKRHNDSRERSCSVRDNSLRDTSDICSKIGAVQLENGTLQNSGLGTNNLFGDTHKCAQPPSILKKTQPLTRSNQSSTLMLQPSQRLREEMPIELTNFRICTASSSKSSTLSAPLSSTLDLRIGNTASGLASYNYVTDGTLDRHRVHIKECKDLTVYDGLDFVTQKERHNY